MKAQQAKLEADKRKLKEAFDASEQRATKLELARRALEGDLQRNKMAINDKETSNQVRPDRKNRRCSLSTAVDLKELRNGRSLLNSGASVDCCISFFGNTCGCRLVVVTWILSPRPCAT